MVTVPVKITELENESYHLFLEGLIEDKPVRLLIDTGASKTVLDQQFIKNELPDLLVEASDDLTGGLGASELKSSYAQIQKLHLNDFQISDVRVAVLDLNHVNQSYNRIKQPPIQGIVGSDLLKKFAAVIDYGKAHILFSAQ